MSFLKKAAGFVLGAVGAVVGFIAAGPAGAAIGFSIGMGIGSAVQMAAMKTKIPDVSSATGQRLNVSIDPDAYRTIAFGETALGTDQRYWESWGPENSYFDQVIAAAGHEIESFGKLYFDDEEVTFSGDTATGAYAGALTKQDRVVGVTGTALTVGAGTLWTSAASMTGVAHYALRIRWSQEKFPRGIPTRITRVGKGAKVYDPRRDSTMPGGSGSHRANDQSTWQYSPTDSNGVPIGRNPALQMLWYEIGWRVTNPDTSEAILVCGRGRPLDDINFASFITAANDCEDEEYYSDVLLSTGDPHETNIAVLEAACAGKLMDNGGRIGLRIRTDTTGDIVQAFTDGDVLDQDASDWIPSEDMPQRWNQGIGSFVDPAALYKIIPLPTVRDATYEAEDGFRRPGPAFRFDAVQSAAQGQKLIRLELNMSRYQGVFTAPFNWRAKKVQVWDCVTLTFPRLGFENRIFRVLEKKTDPMGAIWILLREDDPSIYEGGTVNPVPAPSPGAGYDPRVVSAPDAGDWTVTPAYIEGGGAKIPTLLVSGEAPAPNIAAIHVEFRQGLSGDWIYEGRFTTFQAIRLDRASLAPGQPYYVRLSYENAYNVRSAWTQLGPYSAPADFTALSSLLSDAFVGQGALATEDQVTWATQVTGVGKPEDYATLSRVFRQDTAPSSPNTNDIWVQTSGGSPIAVRAWNGSAWVTGADITIINTAAAITGQDWGATAAEAAASNDIIDAKYRPVTMPERVSVAADFTTSFTTFNAAALTIGTVSTVANEGSVRTFDSSVMAHITNRSAIALLPGRTYECRSRSRVTVDGTSNAMRMSFRVFAADGTYLGARAFTNIDTSWTASKGWQEHSITATTAAILAAFPTAAFIKGYAVGNGTTGSVLSGATWQQAFLRLRDATDPIKLATVETGADVTGTKTASAIAGQGVYATANYYSSETDPAPVPDGSDWYKPSTKELKKRVASAWQLMGRFTDAALAISRTNGFVKTRIGAGTITSNAVSFSSTGGSGTGYTYAHELFATYTTGPTLTISSASGSPITASAAGAVPGDEIRGFVQTTVTDSAGNKATLLSPVALFCEI